MRVIKSQIHHVRQCFKQKVLQCSRTSIIKHDWGYAYSYVVSVHARHAVNSGFKSGHGTHAGENFRWATKGEVVERLFTVRGQSYLSPLPKYWSPIPLSASVSSLPPTKAGVHTRRAERGMGGQYFGRRERKDCPLTVNNLSTGAAIRIIVHSKRWVRKLKLSLNWE